MYRTEQFINVYFTELHMYTSPLGYLLFFHGPLIVLYTIYSLTIYLNRIQIRPALKFAQQELSENLYRRIGFKKDFFELNSHRLD